MSAEFYMRTSLGDIMARFTSDLEVIQAGFTQATFNTVLTALALLINVPVMLWLEWRLGVMALMSLPLILLANRQLVPRASQATYVLKQTEGARSPTPCKKPCAPNSSSRPFGLQRTDERTLQARN